MRRLKTVVFCVTVEQARKVATILKETHGVRADWVCGDKSLCPDSERRRILRDFADGRIDCIANVGVLTTGWDCPSLEHIVMARPTKSIRLFTQIMGRGTRPLPGTIDFAGSTPELRKAAIAESPKPHFRFTDLYDNSRRHKLITPIDVLGGELGLEDDILAMANKALEDSENARPLSELIEEARERKRQAEEAERERLARFKAEANYRLQEIDIFGGAVNTTRPKEKKERGARMLFGKHRGKLVREVPTGYLQWALKEDAIKVDWLREAVSRELDNRMRVGA